jgi:hypothetical protein
VDGPEFDTLIKRFSTTTISRSTALRRLAASVAAFTGVALAAQPGAAEQRKICHCTDETATSCETLTLGRNAARIHLRDHPCDRRGKCRGVSGCCLEIGISCTSPLSCCSGNCLGNCQPCKSNGSFCGSDSECCSKRCNSSGTCRRR